jgi:hypothetical protein
MLPLLIGIVLAAAAAAYWFVARRPKEDKNAPQPKKASGARFGSVEIRTRAGACDAARALEGQRFLAKDAPALPLPACTAGKCTCTFSKLPDRRTEERRLEHGGLSAAMFLDKNRREKRDRRRRKKSA